MKEQNIVIGVVHARVTPARLVLYSCIICPVRACAGLMSYCDSCCKCRY